MPHPIQLQEFKDDQNNIKGLSHFPTLVSRQIEVHANHFHGDHWLGHEHCSVMHISQPNKSLKNTRGQGRQRRLSHLSSKEEKNNVRLFSKLLSFPCK